tara:strand:- start:2027 stop:3703 length:1677 start_codon:yes stop_codon:yes gene_type:complete
MGFHLDTTGNVWLGSGSEGDTLSDAITAGPPNFYVTSAGSIFAQAGTIGGITVDSTGIYANYSSTSGFKIFSSDGSAIFEDVEARGIISGTVDTTLTAGSTGEFKSSSGTDRVTFGGLGGPTLFFVYGSSTTGKINAANDDFLIQSEASNDNLILRAGGSGAQAKMTLNANEIEFMGQASGTFAPTINIPHTTDLQFSSTSGNTGQVLTKTNTGLSWQNTSGHSHGNLSFPNSGTVLSDDTHSHNSTNTVLNTNTSFTGMINHIAESVGNSGTAHGLTLANVLTDSNHSHGAVGNVNAITSNYNNNVTSYNTAFSAAGAFNLYNTINSALNNKANNSALHNSHNYFTNADVDGSHHSHNAYLTGNESHFNNASAHGQYVYYNDYLTHISNFNSHKNSNNSHSTQIAAAVNSHYNAYISGHLSSDRRFKTNIDDTSLGLEFIKRLQPREFDWTSDYLDDLLDSNDKHAVVARNIYTNIQQGFIVDEVKDAVFEQTGSNNAFSGLTYNPRNKDELDTLDESNPVGYIRPTDFIPPLVKAVQELSAKIELLEARVDELEGV